MHTMNLILVIIMINRIGLGELGIGSNSDHRYDNCKRHPLYIFVE
jgi:hypothetical protein